MLTLIPMVGELVKQFSPSYAELLNDTVNSQKRPSNCNNKDINAKYLKSMIQERIKKYIMGDNNSDEDSDNEGVDILNDNSNSSEK